MDNSKLYKKLMSITKESEIEKFIADLDVADSCEEPKNKKYMWRFLGESLSNSANVHTTSVTIAPIIERITNAFDAKIQLKEYDVNNGSPLSKEKLPKSPREAVSQWFNIAEGDTAMAGNIMSLAERTKLSEEVAQVSLYDSDALRYPTIIVRDIGIGQHPDDFKTTLLSLGRSNKFTSPHLHGTFGHGGSSTYRFSKYTIILSRRAPHTTNKNDVIGWTIIRKDESLKVWNYMDGNVVDITQPPVYEYLCYSDGTIPMIESKYAKGFDQGTYIAHIHYNAKDWENLSRGLGFRLFRNYLFDPVLPFRLLDCREKTEEFNRNIFGDRSILSNAPYVPYRNEAHMEWPGNGKLLVRYWLLHDEKNPSNRPLKFHLERENSRNTIIVTLNGQRHGALEKSIISKKSRLPRVGESLLVQVVLDYLPRIVKGKLFTSGRDKMVEEGDERELLERMIIEAFSEDDKLREWEDRLGDIRSDDDESIKVVKDMLDKLLDIGNEAGFGGSEKAKTEGGTGTSKKYVPHDPPTSFRIITKQDPIEITKNSKKVIFMEINGPDNLFSRRKNRGYVNVSLKEDSGINVSIMTSKFSNGRLPIAFFPKSNATEFDNKKIKFVFESDNLSQKLESTRNYTIIPEEKYVAVDPPTEFKILRSSPISLTQGRNNTIPIIFNGPNDYLSRASKRGYLEISFNYKHTKHITRIGPFNGKIQVTLYVDSDAKENDRFDLTCKLKLPDGKQLIDKKECIIQKKKESKDDLKGADTTVSRPNYKIIPVRREGWAKMGWNEQNVGTFEMGRDEGSKDILRLYVNVDNHNIDDERNRRRRLNQPEKGIQRIETKYIAHIAYHLYQQYESEKEDYNIDTISKDEEPEEIKNKALNEEQKEEELKRVSKTLVLSFKTMKSLDDDD